MPTQLNIGPVKNLNYQILVIYLLVYAGFYYALSCAYMLCIKYAFNDVFAAINGNKKQLEITALTYAEIWVSYKPIIVFLFIAICSNIFFYFKFRKNLTEINIVLGSILLFFITQNCITHLLH
ncbi:hypothetical protein BDD43_3993 [Mucilaginibacter gracilis]|uniref:Uncharacterized protein n=1 Tax=Mucilaginibacter gracilis TaxID=423350 RepID=A0A495J6Y7_9SPHI|nr:hypothetical protein [Mucilaginibacter gracilis]RKR83779.1 hypothetical protein BDD43_3993 [Mucilaginibacter gracilis]